VEIFITGRGVVSALGKNTQENLQSLLNGQTGICLGSYSDYPEKYLGVVKLTSEELSDTHALMDGYSRTALLGLTAAKEAWGNNDPSSTCRTGVISGNSVGGMDRTEKNVVKLINGQGGDIRSLLSHPCGHSTGLISNIIPRCDYSNTISTACSSGANSILQAVKLIKNGRLDRAIAGGTDGLSNFTIQGFSSLMIFDEKRCSPFDTNRAGLNLGEGAGYVLLENEKSLKESGNTPLGKISGYGIANDSFHQTALSPNGLGAVLAMRQALHQSKLEARDIDYINTHGTATENNDEVELRAIQSLFTEKVPDYSSTKSFTGHTLGASGAIEAVYSLLAINNNCAFPSLNIENDMNKECPALKKLIRKNISNVLTNSFGFGGNQTTLIVSEC
jgi:3-oxoacyl-(acyl-carrier-protein) synthase